MLKSELLIINKRGLHARAASKLIGTTSQFQSQIKLGTDANLIDAKNIMAVMMLAAGIGTTLTIQVDGADEQEALAAVTDLFARRFDEGE